MKHFSKLFHLFAMLIIALSVLMQVQPVGASQAHTDTTNITYVDLVVDVVRNRLYGTDKVGNKIDVVDMDSMLVISSYNLAPGSNPTYLDIRPDGAELAVVQYGLTTVAFIDLSDGTVTQSTSLGANGSDVLYGRDGILYVLSNVGIHIFDTYTHTEDLAQKVAIGSYVKTGVLSADKNVLYLVDNSPYSGYSIAYKFDVSEGLAKPVKLQTATLASNTSYISQPEKYIKLNELGNDCILASSGWVLDPMLVLKSKTTLALKPTISIPTRSFYAVATDETGTADKIHFFDQTSSHELSWISTDTVGTLGAITSTPDGTSIYVSSTAGMSKININETPPGTPVPLPVSTHQYRDLAIDLAKNVVYGTSTSGTVDIISADNGSVQQEFLLPSGANPIGIDLSPDGSEIAVALNGLRSILFMNPISGETIASVQTTIGDEGSIYYLNQPFDVIYGRAGRLYSNGNPGSGGMDYIHVIDTAAHAWIARSPYPNLRTGAEFALTADKQYLYANQTFSPNNIYVYDVRTDTVTGVYNGPHGYVSAKQFTISPDGHKVFTSNGQVWTGIMSEQIGSFSSGNLIEYLPGKDAFALTVRSGAVDVIKVFKASDYQLISTYTLPNSATILEMESAPDGSKLALNLSNGQVLILDLNTLQALILDGTNQLAIIGQAFAKPLKVKVQNVLGMPVSELAVTFTAPENEASATFSDTDTNVTTAITDENGIATSAALVANDITGSYVVTATATGFLPPLNFNLTNYRPFYDISGNAGAAGVTLSYVDGTSKTVTTGTDGNYTISVPYGWTGVITPAKIGYTFSPVSINIATPVTLNLSGQNFSATLITYTISGTLGTKGAGAIVAYTGGSSIADSKGNYSFRIPYGWTGSITPSKPGYAFTPTSIIITTPVTSNLTNKNFTTKPSH